jgi:large subunit ribosomal protein L29
VKIAEIREVPSDELLGTVVEQRRALFNLRFQKETEQLERPAELRQIKRDIARMLSVLREREIAEGASAPQAE